MSLVIEFPDVKDFKNLSHLIPKIPVMSKIILIPFLFVLSNFCTVAQNLQLQTGNTYAVVIGISDYDLITDLQFAHRDAEEFAAYLQSPAGGNIPAENVHLLTNEEATMGQMVSQMGWLLEVCEKGDRAIIYFSGHGDVETQTINNFGFLLMYNTPPVNYMGTGYDLNYLNSIVSTLSESKGVKVTVIADACRSGKLAGKDIKGAQITAANLAQKISNEVKILSCQPDEFSMEGKQWGGGRGVFSYHLVEGLTGLADNDENLQVKLIEIDGYLKNKVPRETENMQIPNTIGDLKSTVAYVDEESLTTLKVKKSNETLALEGVRPKTIYQTILANTDSTILELFVAFEKAIKQNNLLYPIDSSANDYYKILIKEEGIAQLHGYIRRNFAAALQDESQDILNQLLLTDPQIVDDVFSPVSKYDHIPAYLQRAGELLGRDHYMYSVLKARQYFFQSKTYRKENYQDYSADSLSQLSFASLDTALSFDSTAAYLYFEKGLKTFWIAAQIETASKYFRKAMELSPNWVLPIYYFGRTHFTDDAKGTKYLKKALECDSTFLPTYERLGWYVQSTEEKHFWRSLYVQKMEKWIEQNPNLVPVSYYRYLGLALYYLERFSEAEKYLLKSGNLSNYEDPLIYQNLAFLYEAQGRYQEAKRLNKKYLELRPNDFFVHTGLNPLFFKLNQFEEAEEYFKQKLSDSPKMRWLEFNLVFLYFNKKEYSNALDVLLQNEDSKVDPLERHMRIGQLYELMGQPELAKLHFQKLLADNVADLFDYVDYQAIGYAKLKDIGAFKESLQAWKHKHEGSPFYKWRLACLYAFIGENKQSLAWLEKALQEGLHLVESREIIWGTFYNPDFHQIRETKAFKKLVKKYEPGHLKILKK